MRDTDGNDYPVLLPKAFCHLDRFMIINTKTGNAIEGHFNTGRAEHARDVLNDHETRNGRAAVYTVKEIQR